MAVIFILSFAVEKLVNPHSVDHNSLCVQVCVRCRGSMCVHCCSNTFVYISGKAYTYTIVYMCVFMYLRTST